MSAGAEAVMQRKHAAMYKDPAPLTKALRMSLHLLLHFF